MPIFKTTFNILKKQDENELFDQNWMDRNTAYIPTTSEWDYNREMTVEDVDIWEVLAENGGGLGVYASHRPHAEFYMITAGLDYRNPPRRYNGRAYWDRLVETYYGPGSQKAVYERAKQLGIFLPIYEGIWVDDDDMWLYANK
jgi:hypothetical protein